VHVFDRGLGARPDAEVAATATAESRVPVTENMQDFPHAPDIAVLESRAAADLFPATPTTSTPQPTSDREPPQSPGRRDSFARPELIALVERVDSVRATGAALVKGANIPTRHRGRGTVRRVSDLSCFVPIPARWSVPVCPDMSGNARDAGKIGFCEAVTLTEPDPISTVRIRAFLVFGS
jgi:hypothetical protein